MRLIAHRGFAAINPENTIRAVRAAARVADAVEVDVRRCGSGELVVIHDATVDRVTEGAGPVADHTLADLRSLDVLGTGEGVPTLSAVLAAIPDGVAVNVELKAAETAVEAVAVVTESSTDVWVSSFDQAALAACRTADPTLPLGYLTAEGGRTAVRAAARLDCIALHPARRVCDERLVARAHGAGLSVNAWTVDRPKTARSLAAVGVDGVIADRPDVLPDPDE
jgi:glycerophosphoryl diester phosphodiesterase